MIVLLVETLFESLGKNGENKGKNGYLNVFSTIGKYLCYKASLKISLSKITIVAFVITCFTGSSIVILGGKRFEEREASVKTFYCLGVRQVTWIGWGVSVLQNKPGSSRNYPELC